MSSKLFKKKEDKEGTLKGSGKSTKMNANSLALLISQMQNSADQVEKDILYSEGLLAEDAENDKKELPFEYQNEISTKLGEAEALLKELFLDVDKAKKLNHPQAREIENDVLHLHERWLKDCHFYREIYEQIDDVSLMPRIDWAPVFNQKQKAVSVEEYGPTMADLEKQIAAHNILHKELEVYNSQLCVSSAGSKEQYTALKKQYNNILENSKWRRHYLKSLYEYMQGCNKELAFLDTEQDKIKKQDWSDHMSDPADVRRQYENFKNNSLLSHESEVNRVQEEGDRLVELKHPASATIQAQKDAVRNEWQRFLNLCICEETHLDNVEEYKRYQLETDQLSETLTKLNKNLDPKAIRENSNAETLLQLEAEEKEVQNCEQQLADLRRRSTNVAPLKLRRTSSSRPTTVESLCDWETDKDYVSRGDKFTLKSNSDTEDWDIIAPDGSTKTFPGICFQVPPPNPEAIDKVDLLGGELADIKRRRAAVRESLKNHKSNVVRSLQSAPVSSAPPDPKATALAQQLSKLDSDLAFTEQSMLNRLRTPLNRTDPTTDLNNRLREQERAARDLQDLDQKKMAAEADLQPLLANNTSSAIPLQLNATKNKSNNIAALADLYNKKANASLNLQNQIKTVDGLVSGFETKLSQDAPISSTPHAIEDRAEDIKSQRRSVAAAQGDVRKLGQDLETTEKLCNSLQQGYQEFCPDIGRQKTEVKQLQTRYSNVENQLKEKENILQEAAIKNQEFQSTSRSLSSFLDNLPTNQIHSSDDLSQIADKQMSQERVMDDLKRKEDDVDRLGNLSHDLQSLLNEYESNTDRYNSTLEDAGATVDRRSSTFSLADAVQKEEKSLSNRFAEATAENNQRQKQMGLAKNFMSQNEEKVQVTKQQVQLQSQQNASELSSLMRDLDGEKERTSHTETDLRTFKGRLLSLKSRKGVERIEEKEVVEYYREPKLESDLADLQNKVHEESLRRSTIHSEVQVFQNKITTVDDTLKNTKPKLVTREVTEFERDPQLDVEAGKLRDEIMKMRDEIRVRDGEHIQMKTEVNILQQQSPPIREKIVQKEVLKVEQDPEMLRAVGTFQTEISDESNKSKLLNDEIFQTRAQINSLQRLIPSIKPKVITKEVKRIEQDPELITESSKIRRNMEEEVLGNSSLSLELKELQSRYQEVQFMKPRVEVKEIVNEIYHVDPNTEKEIIRINRDLHNFEKQCSDLDKEISQVTYELNIQRNEKPKVELKEVLQEVIKEERSPENEREIRRLNDQVNHLHTSYSSLQDNVNRLRRERDEWKAEKSKIETKLVTREVIRYEPDPLLEKEADRLRRDVREEAKLRRTTEEMVFDLQNRYLQLERQKPEEKVVVQEVVRLQRDPRQIVDHDNLSKNLDDEIKTRRQTELELQQLRTKVEDIEKILGESDDRQRRMKVESELREIRLRIVHLQNAPPPVEESIVVEEVLKVERDQKLERKTNGFRADLDRETSDIMRLHRDIRSITLKLEILQKEKSSEKTVYKEVVRVEKDQAVQAERDHLREQVLQQKYARQDLEDEIRRLNDKTNLLMSSKSSSSRDETSLSFNRDALHREREDLTRELRTLEAKRQETSMSFQQQSRRMSERQQVNRQRNVRMETDSQRLEREILDEKDTIHQRDSTIRKLLLQLEKEDQAETRTKETNVSTKITILDPDTGKDMSPYDAYLQGLIDRQQYIHLQELECDWEEITSMGPEGETSVLQDRKSGRQYSIKDALKEGRLTEYDLQQYKQGKIPISEFALLVAGDNKRPQFNSILPMNSSPSPLATAREISPIAGVIDTNSDFCYTIRSASLRKLIDATTAQKLLEAQASTGGIIDISNKERYTVSKAATRGLIEDSHIQRLLNAQKAFTGIDDPITRERLSVGEAVQKGWMPKESAIRYMEAQYLTGGLILPETGQRVSLLDALGSKMIDNTILRELQMDSAYTKDILDPITKERINYKQALDRCKKDPATGLPMLPASSKDTSYTPLYNSTTKYARF